ncbi:histone acetyltransferase type B catalytic subunit-like [Prunus yedoensis var. nudiflora]|uniref:Histone acetyltransferase type B catalytic subunit-like n=1 Tax=Prunus yedoensis var. nudiflora TaxID=2094558 RepID=A0A314Z7T0_PRUYE|nr:histone acetyltransferase type B catalytic subunit-like [Prunus yedoensis var. nudiflora]
MPDTRVIEDVRKSLKINKKQFLQCWEVFLYLGLDHVDRSQAGEAASTVQIDENQPNQEEQLQQLVDERVKEIKSIAEKVSVQLSIVAEAS